MRFDGIYLKGDGLRWFACCVTLSATVVVLLQGFEGGDVGGFGGKERRQQVRERRGANVHLQLATTQTEKHKNLAKKVRRHDGQLVVIANRTCASASPLQVRPCWSSHAAIAVQPSANSFLDSCLRGTHAHRGLFGPCAKQITTVQAERQSPALCDFLPPHGT